MDLMASSAVVYSAPHTVMDLRGWYTTTVPCSTAPPSRSEVTATCGSCGTLSNLTTSGTGLRLASGAGPAGSSNTMAHSARPHTALHALLNADAPSTIHRGGGSRSPPACGVRRGTYAGSPCCRSQSKTSPNKNIREDGGTNGMHSPGQSEFQSLSLYPPTTYASPQQTVLRAWWPSCAAPQEVDDGSRDWAVGTGTPPGGPLTTRGPAYWARLPYLEGADGLRDIPEAARPSV